MIEKESIVIFQCLKGSNISGNNRKQKLEARLALVKEDSPKLSPYIKCDILAKIETNNLNDWSRDSTLTHMQPFDALEKQAQT